MPLTQRRRYPNNAARRTQFGPASLSQGLGRTPIRVALATSPGANQVDVTFDQPIILSGIPQYVANGKLPISAERTTPNMVVLVYVALGAFAQIDVPFEDPSVRNSAGGFVRSGVVLAD